MRMLCELPLREASLNTEAPNARSHHLDNISGHSSLLQKKAWTTFPGWVISLQPTLDGQPFEFRRHGSDIPIDQKSAGYAETEKTPIGACSRSGPF